MVLLVAAAAILCGAAVVAIGRGGEMGGSTADIRPVDPDFSTAADVALLRPPASLWGYNMRATDEALSLVARTVTERDVEIANLRRQLAELKSAAENPLAPRPGQGQIGRPGPAAPGGRPLGVSGPAGLTPVPAAPPEWLSGPAERTPDRRSPARRSGPRTRRSGPLARRSGPCAR